METVTALGRTFEIHPVSGSGECTGCAADGDGVLCRAIQRDCTGLIFKEVSPSPEALVTIGYPTGTDPSPGTKHDGGKPPMSLLDGLWLAEVAKVLDFGAKKYSPHNWRGGISQSRLLSAALRHLHAFNGGEDLDPETGLSHLAHASCCLMFATNMALTRPDMDDRYKAPQ